MINIPTPDFAKLAAQIPAGGHIVIHSGFAEPGYLCEQLAVHSKLFKGIHLHTLMAIAPPPYSSDAVASDFIVETFFPGPGLRSAVNKGLVKTQRCILSEIPGFFTSKKIVADLLLLQVSQPNEQGQVSLGISVDYIPEVIAQKPIIVVQINANMPFTPGNSCLSLEDIDYCVQVDESLLMFPDNKADSVDTAIALHVASLIEDGDVIQAGIGALPDTVLANLGHLKHLGAHTGILTSAWLPLIEGGVVDNSTKDEFSGVSITTMAGGDEHLYRFLDYNAHVEFHPCSMTHDFARLSAIKGLVAINSVLQLDLAGNGNAESVAGRIIAAPGGLPDFARGASAASGGKSIIALRSSFKNAEHSNILGKFEMGTPTCIDQTMIDHVVTEYGCASLTGLSDRARAEALISIAHPDHQEHLSRENPY